MQRVHVTIWFIDRARRGDERLSRNLPTVDSLSVFHRRLTTEDVDFDQFEIEECDEIVEGARHAINVASIDPENRGCSVGRDDCNDARGHETSGAGDQRLHAGKRG